MRLKYRIAFILIALIIAAAVSTRANPLPIDTSQVDSLYFDSIQALGIFGQATLPVYFSTQKSLGGFNVAIRLNSPDVTIDSISFIGGYIESLLPNGFSTQDSSLVFFCTPFSGWIPAGTGKLGDIYLSYDTSITDQLVMIDTATLVLHETFRTQFVDTLTKAWVPQVRPGFVDVKAGTCCLNFRGNIDYNVADDIDILDLTYLVQFMFRGGPAPPCLEEANVNGIGPDDLIDVGDLVYLVAFMFKGGPLPATCP